MTTPPPTSRTELEVLRAQIEDINHRLLELLNRRAGVALAIQRLKSRDGIPTRVPAREQAMLDDLARENRGPFSDEAVARIFQAIFDASVALMAERARILEFRRASRDGELPTAVNA
jgi:3-deoxy-7-phosphoheptulonate synthase / chorismate mutase